MRTRTMHNEWIRLISATSLLGLAAIAPTEGWVTGLSKQEIGKGVQLKIEGTGLSKPREIRVLGGAGYIVEFDAQLQGGPKKLTVDSGGVSTARAGWYHSKPPVVRVLVRLNPNEKPILAACADGYTVSVNFATPPAPTAVQTPKQAVSVAQMDPMVKQPMPVDASKAKAEASKAKEAAAAQQRVSLDFINTDVVQIIKALALQADVNIITAPEVQGLKITVSLDKVTVDDALQFVSALAGLRYARVQDSYVVTTRNTFGQIMTDLARRNPQQNVIHIVPIISGDGAAIKSALARWFGPTTLQVLLPGEQDQQAQGSAGSGSGAATPATGGGTPAGGGQGAATGQAQPPQAPPAQDNAKPADSKGTQDSPYLLLIGEAKWVAQAEALVHQLDEQVLDARGQTKHMHRMMQDQDDLEAKLHALELLKGKPEQSRATYMVQNGVAMELKKVVDESDKNTGVMIVASPPKSTVQTLLLSGPEEAVNSTLTMLRTLDTGAGSTAEVFSYDIKFADPRSLREDLVANVPGLIVTNPPAGAANPRLYQKGQAFGQQAQTQATTQPSGVGANNQAATSTTGQAGVKGGQAAFGDVSLVFEDMEPTSLPMRLILRGSKGQIEDAMKYLAKVDVAPKQIAIEMRVMELSKEDALKLGIDWIILTGGTVKTINLNQSASGIGSNSTPNNTIGARIGLNGSSFAGVTATLDAIANKNNLISRPNLLAIDGRNAEIFVGDDIRYVESIIASQTGPTIQSADIQVGVRLSVLARIGGDGNITMDLRPVVSFLKGFNSVTGQGVTLNLPQTSLRVAQSTVNVQSGETIAIGGLIQDQDILNVQKVPILGDIPILGQLFRSTSHDRIRTEVVFFLTVKELKQGDRHDSADPRSVEKTNKGELPIPPRKVIP